MDEGSSSRIMTLFLQGSRLRKVMSHLCNHCSSNIADPISDTVVMMLTCPIHLVITEVGIALFKDRPTALFPYTEMDSEQLYFVEEVVQSCLLQCNRITELPSPASSTGSCGLPYYHLYHHAVVQMGGGCILYTKRQLKKVAGKKAEKVCASEPEDEIDKADVLRGMCDCIFASKDYGDAGVLKCICNIILQRVSCMTTLRQDDQRAVHAYIAELCQD